MKQAGSEGDERALEDLQELGEQNEVYLDELERDAKKNSKKWKEGARPAKLNKLAHEMDLAAEALRKRYSEKRLKEVRWLGTGRARAGVLAADKVSFIAGGR